jgi:hypothetical protein
MTDKPPPTPEPTPEPQRDVDPALIERRSIDPALIGGIIAGAGAAVGPALGVLTDHLLNEPDNSEPGPTVVLPPGVDTNKN